MNEPAPTAILIDLDDTILEYDSSADRVPTKRPAATLLIAENQPLGAQFDAVQPASGGHVERFTVITPACVGR